MLTDVLLGIINRGAPQVNVFALSQVVKGPIGIAAIMIALLPTWNYVRDHALTRVCPEQTTITKCGKEGPNSMVHLAEQMDRSNDELVRQERQRNFKAAGEVS
jgi:hypothetical protein